MTLFKRSQSNLGASAESFADDAVSVLEAKIRSHQSALDQTITAYGDQIVGQVGASVERITRSVESSIDRVTGKVEGGIEFVAEKVVTGATHLGEAWEHVAGAGQTVYASVDEHVQKRPLAVMAVAVGLGLIASRVIGSSRAARVTAAGSTAI